MFATGDKDSVADSKKQPVFRRQEIRETTTVHLQNM